jgi:hypothetical protein
METTTNEVPELTRAEKRSAQLQGLYELIHWLVDHEDVTIPYWLQVQHIIVCDTLDEAAEVRRQIGRCEKTANDTFIGFERDFGGGIKLAAVILRDSVCERVEVGTRHVEAREAYDEPVYEYVCPESLLETAQQ